MKQFIQSFKNAAKSFSKEEDGAQVIEYALIIAVVSIALVTALSTLTTDNGNFSTFISKVGNCLTSGSCTAAPTTP